MLLFQVQASLDILGVLSRHAAALTSARDGAAVAAANTAALQDWATCLEAVQQHWTGLARRMPPDALGALGWRVKPGLRLPTDAPVESLPHLFERSRLGVEMLLRPWVDAPDLAHTDEFVA